MWSKSKARRSVDGEVVGFAGGEGLSSEDISADLWFRVLWRCWCVVIVHAGRRVELPFV